MSSSSKSYKTEQTHQGYIEPHACVANVGPDGQGELWVTTQGHFVYRNQCAALLGMDINKLRVTASEIGGGFGGKTHVWAEPVALALSRKANRPVKLIMTRDEVFRATGPTIVDLDRHQDRRQEGRHHHRRPRRTALPERRLPLHLGRVRRHDVLCLLRLQEREVGARRTSSSTVRRCAAYRAPSAPMAAFAVESTMDEVAKKIGMDPVEFRIKNAAKEGTKSSYGPVYGPIGIGPTLEAAKNHPHMKAPLGKNQGRGMACGFWFNFGGQTCVDLNVTPDGTVTLAVGTIDVGGSRASIGLMAAEELGIPYENVRVVVADTSSLGHNDMTDGSRGTFSTVHGRPSTPRATPSRCCAPAPPRCGTFRKTPSIWEDGHAKPAGTNAGNFPPLSLKEIAAAAGNTGGPIAGHNELVADGAGVSFATHICDVEVDPETGRTTVKRYTVIQDAGKAIHPSYVEGQYQGGAAQGIGWALNEEYIYGKDGRLQNAGFLDYRIPVCSDLPMIDTQILEIPNPNHPYGVRGVGETSIVPPLAAIANAMSNAVGVRMTHIPMSPPRVLKAISNRKH